jgi:hypothetical protein
LFPQDDDLPYFFDASVLSAMGTSKLAGATFPFFQLAKDKVILALPLPASAGTRTGP